MSIIEKPNEDGMTRFSRQPARQQPFDGMTAFWRSPNPPDDFRGILGMALSHLISFLFC